MVIHQAERSTPAHNPPQLAYGSLGGMMDQTGCQTAASSTFRSVPRAHSLLYVSQDYTVGVLMFLFLLP